jgi:hypothetical protein
MSMSSVHGADGGHIRNTTTDLDQQPEISSLGNLDGIVNHQVSKSCVGWSDATLCRAVSPRTGRQKFGLGLRHSVFGYSQPRRDDKDAAVDGGLVRVRM